MNQRLSERKARARHYVAWGRFCLLALVAISLVNQLLLALGVEYHFLISAAVPYYLNWVCKKMTLGGVVSALALVAAIGICAAYGAFWVLSRRQKIWLTAALGVYALDTLLLIIFTFTMLDNPGSCVLEILTHCGCLGLLAMAVHSAAELSRIRQAERAHCAV